MAGLIGFGKRCVQARRDVSGRAEGLAIERQAIGVMA
jgi:hypothetical protein